MDEKGIALKVSKVTIIQNFLLSLFKFIAGVIGHSQAMISDAIHSASDVISTVIVIIGVKMSAKESDEEHQYGHERYECISAIILAMMLGITGFLIGLSGAKQIYQGTYADKAMPGILALVAAVISIVVKECMFRYTKKAAKQIKSDALMADAWHHRSDALSSIGSLVGIAGCMAGIKVMDAAASVVISLFIMKAAFDIAKDTVDKLVDKACDKDTRDRLYAAAIDVEGVEGIDILRTRLFGSKIYVDLEICVDGNLSVIAAHQIAENVHDKIEAEFEEVKHCMVHVNPVIS